MQRYNGSVAPMLPNSGLRTKHRLCENCAHITTRCTIPWTIAAIRGRVPHTTLCITPPWSRFSMVDVSAVRVVSVSKTVGIGTISPRAFRRRIVRYWHPRWLSSNRAWKIAPWVCDAHRHIMVICNMNNIPHLGQIR